MTEAIPAAGLAPLTASGDTVAGVVEAAEQPQNDALCGVAAAPLVSSEGLQMAAAGDVEAVKSAGAAAADELLHLHLGENAAAPEAANLELLQLKPESVALPTQLQLEQLNALQQHVQNQLLQAAATTGTPVPDGEAEGMQIDPGAGVAERAAGDEKETGPGAGPHFTRKRKAAWGGESGGAEGEPGSAALLLPATGGATDMNEVQADHLRLLVLQQGAKAGAAGVPLGVAAVGGRVTPSATGLSFPSLQFPEEPQSPEKASALPSLLGVSKKSRRGMQASDPGLNSSSLSPSRGTETGKPTPANPLLLLGDADHHSASSLSTPHGTGGHGNSTEATPSSAAGSGDRKVKREEMEPIKTRRSARAAAAAAAAQAAAAMAAAAAGEAAKADAVGKEKELSAGPQDFSHAAVARAASQPGALASIPAVQGAGVYLDQTSAALSGLVVPGLGKGGLSAPGIPAPGLPGAAAGCAPVQAGVSAALLPAMTSAGLAGAAPGAVSSLLPSTTTTRGSHAPGAAGAQAAAGAQGAAETGEYERNDLLMRPGVSYYGGRQAWVAEIKYGGRRRFKVFSVAKYGYEGAKQMAVDTRERWEEAREAGELDQLMMSSQRHQCPVQSGVKGVYYDTARKGWRVVVTLNCRQMSKFFLASKFGNAEAKRLAIECRQMWLDAIQNGRADDVFEKARKLVSFKTKGAANNAANGGHSSGAPGAAPGATGAHPPPSASAGASVGVCGGAPGGLQGSQGALLGAARFAGNGAAAAGSPHQAMGAAGVGGPDLPHASSVLLAAAASGGAAGGLGGLQGPSPGLLNSSLTSCLGKFGATPPGTGLSADGTSSSCLFSANAAAPSLNLRDASNELLLAAAAANASSAHAGTAALLSGLPGGAAGVPGAAGVSQNGTAGATGGEGASSLAAAAAAAAFLTPASLSSVPRGVRDPAATAGNAGAGGAPTDEAAAAGAQGGAAAPAGGPSAASFGLAAFTGAGGAPGAAASGADGASGAAGAAGTAAGAALLAAASQQGFDPKLLQQQQLAEQQLMLQQWGEAAAAFAGGVGIPQGLFSSAAGCADGDGNAGAMRDPAAAANHQQLQLQLLQELNRGASLPPLLDVLWGQNAAAAGAAAAAARGAGATPGPEGTCAVGENGELFALQTGAGRTAAGGAVGVGLGGQEEGGAAGGEGAAAQSACGLSAPVLSLLLQQQGLHQQQLAAAARGCGAAPGSGAAPLCGFNRDGNLVMMPSPIVGGAQGCALSGPLAGDGVGGEKAAAGQLGAVGASAAVGSGMGQLGAGALLGAAGASGSVAAAAAGAGSSKRRRGQQGAAGGLQTPGQNAGHSGAAAGVAGGAGGSLRRHQRGGKDAAAGFGGAGAGGATGVPGADGVGGKAPGAAGAGVGTGTESSTCDVRGVYLDTRNNAWAATMGVHGRNVKKSFAVAKHGYETALQLAIHARRQLERIYWGSSPGDEPGAASSLLGLSGGRGSGGALSAAAAAAGPTASVNNSAALTAPLPETPAAAGPQTLIHSQQPLSVSLQGLCWPGTGGVAQTGAATACTRPDDDMAAATSMAALRGAILDPASLSRLSGENASTAEAAARTAVAAGSLLYGAPFGSSLPAGLAANPAMVAPNSSVAGVAGANAAELPVAPGGVANAAASRLRAGGVSSEEGAAGASGVPGAVEGVLAGAGAESLLSASAPGLTQAAAGSTAGVLPGGPTLLGSGLEAREAAGSPNVANLIASSAAAGGSPSGGLIVRDALAALLLQLDPQQRMALLQGDVNSLNSLQAAFLQNSQFVSASCSPEATSQLFVGGNGAPAAALGAAGAAPSLVLPGATAEGAAAMGGGVAGLLSGLTEDALVREKELLAAGGDRAKEAAGAGEITDGKTGVDASAAKVEQASALAFGPGHEEAAEKKGEQAAMGAGVAEGKEDQVVAAAGLAAGLPSVESGGALTEAAGADMPQQLQQAPQEEGQVNAGLNGKQHAAEERNEGAKSEAAPVSAAQDQAAEVAGVDA
ncbi:AP2 domain transcription factor AP2X-7 [Besnoitia besnoiti]|uniref:AP2 domain transcription factor AP2X-7 n=1 Tax=Besnoitia besnoiti TaxID=94643 RepID=A0A2A9ML83_BESBE|nr:AP2 domain transcription factor AP2X-7 [Besnoitia besnoiti]PFH37071.1 AP2 domain transcription factor AP2X-7 [Besnoitia besnoiti]